jgi:hypothetical protein
LYRLYKYTVVIQVYVYRIINFVSSVQVHSRVSNFQVPVLKVRSQFRSQLKFLQGANFFKPKQWMIACTTTSFVFSFMYKWSGFVCTNVNVCIVLLYKYTVVFQVYVYRIINFVSSVQVHSRDSSVRVQNY